jgi:MYXO-CTERM domain-containing protein
VDGDITPQQTKAISFIATVNSANSANLPCDENGVGSGVCNTALVQIDETGATPSGTPRTSRILCPTGNRTDRLITSGSGGCSLGTDADPTKSEIWPVMLLGALLWLRQWRRRSSRA